MSSQLVQAELGFKIQTLHVLWNGAAHLRRSGTLSAKLSPQCMLVNLVVLCFSCKTLTLSSAWWGDVYGCGYETQGSEVETAPWVR